MEGARIYNVLLLFSHIYFCLHSRYAKVTQRAPSYLNFNSEPPPVWPPQNQQNEGVLQQEFSWKVKTGGKMGTKMAATESVFCFTLYRRGEP